MNDAYKKAGVDIDAGEDLIRAIGPMARATARPGTNAALGGFGGLFDLKAAGFSDPILVSGTDGVGTKLKIAFELKRHDTIGIDLVAMCVNDVLAQGAEPLFFLDYFATGKLSQEVAASVVSGIAAGCKLAGCALIGGETAEMPGMYGTGEYDLAGFCVGAVERENILPRKASVGDVMIGLASSGAHSNGYSLLRKVVSESGAALNAPAPFDSSRSLGEALMAPTRIYVKSVLPLLTDQHIKAFAHITGGGLTDNVPRILSNDLAPIYDEEAIAPAPLFQWLQQEGNLTVSDMQRTFNCGIGGVLICAPGAVDNTISSLNGAGEEARVIGEIARV
ncbi:MAG: phosphoribosylformylglycinamidine cyclo-ligase [Alphaproteobacteria bacterium]|nr:phosphoribosylformylglycinamidine cyclo-ligase [Alphaproteobacteria bacterium]